jgi:putative tryptophan/tyrosine transport system substrate-binding protein
MLLAAVPWSARAQQRATKHRIAIFHPESPRPSLLKRGGTAWRAFFSELRRWGYVEGENLIIERYSADGTLCQIGPGDRGQQPGSEN